MAAPSPLHLRQLQHARIVLTVILCACWEAESCRLMMCFEVGTNKEEVVLRMAPDAMLFVVGESLRNRVRLSSFSSVVCAVCACAPSSWRVFGGLL